MRYIIFLLAISLIGCSTGVQTTAVSPRGEFASIDVAQSNLLLRKLAKGDAAAIQQVIDAPGSQTPPVLYAVSSALFDRDRRDEAMQYFYLGQLRARSDANKCLDPSAPAGVSALNEEFGPRINKYAFQDIPRLRKIVEKVIAMDRELPRSYDPRWIALHGMEAFGKGPVRFAPRSKWSEIDEATRDKFWKTFNEMLQANGLKG